jgi:dihydrodipicolinate reductase
MHATITPTAAVPSAVDAGAIVSALAATVVEIAALDKEARRSPKGQRAYAARGALETLLSTAQPGTPAEALALLRMAALQTSRVVRGTTGESRKDLAFKAHAALTAALPVLVAALGHGVGPDVLTILDAYAADGADARAPGGFA